MRSNHRIMEKGNKRKTVPLYIALSLVAHGAFFLSFFILGDRLAAQRLLGEGQHVGLLFVDLGEIGGGEGRGEVAPAEKTPPASAAPQKHSPMVTSTRPRHT